jgi:hypothetical protein
VVALRIVTQWRVMVSLALRPRILPALYPCLNYSSFSLPKLTASVAAPILLLQ